MKKLFLLAGLTLMLSACKQSVKYNIDWDMAMLTASGLTVDSAQVVVDGIVLQTIYAQDGKLVAEGTVDEPVLSTVNIYYSKDGQTGVLPGSVILENGTTTLDYEMMLPKGTPLNDAVAEFETSLRALFDSENAEPEKEIPAMLNKYMEEHKGDLAGVALLQSDEMSYLVDAAELQKQYEQLSDEMKKQPSMVALSEKLELMGKTVAGKMFVDFECEYEGKVQKLSDYVGKGKYVLVDFWASWCGPCRAEIPNLINVYKEYAGDQLEVIGVATWDKPEDTKKTIGELEIPYPQIMNAQDAGSKAYSIEGIPEIILFAPDGTIVKRGLRGAQIEATIQEVLNK